MCVATAALRVPYRADSSARPDPSSRRLCERQGVHDRLARKRFLQQKERAGFGHPPRIRIRHARHQHDRRARAARQHLTQLDPVGRRKHDIEKRHIGAIGH
jgi:hypothetical protein